MFTGDQGQLGKMIEIHLVCSCQYFLYLCRLSVTPHFALAILHFTLKKKTLLFQHSADPSFKAGQL